MYSAVKKIEDKSIISFLFFRSLNQFSRSLWAQFVMDIYLYTNKVHVHVHHYC